MAHPSVNCLVGWLCQYELCRSISLNIGHLANSIDVIIQVGSQKATLSGFESGDPVVGTVATGPTVRKSGTNSLDDMNQRDAQG